MADQNFWGKEKTGRAGTYSLTANILWQVWKDRNKKEFENSSNSLPVRTIEKAHKEWLEHEEIEKSKGRMSTKETAYMHAEQCQGQEGEGTLVLDVATTSQQRQTSLGIGVTARITPNTRTAKWALKERSLGNKVLDDTVALKLVLCKAVQQQWSRVKLNSHNKELMRQITH